MMDEPSVRDAHHGQIDPQIQEEVQDVPTVDLTHTGQLEEIESQLLETPLVEKIAEAVDSSTHHLMKRVFLGILELALAGPTLAVSGLRWRLNMTMIRSHTSQWHS
jgi:hypothetical protein